MDVTLCGSFEWECAVDHCMDDSSLVDHKLGDYMILLKK